MFKQAKLNDSPTIVTSSASMLQQISQQRGSKVQIAGRTHTTVIYLYITCPKHIAPVDLTLSGYKDAQSIFCGIMKTFDYQTVIRREKKSMLFQSTPQCRYCDMGWVAEGPQCPPHTSCDMGWVQTGHNVHFTYHVTWGGWLRGHGVYLTHHGVGGEVPCPPHT